MSILLPMLLAVQLVTLPVPTGFDLAKVAQPVAPQPVVVVTSRCTTDGDTIVICAGRRDRYRLPLPVERDPDRRRAADVPAPAAALTSAAPCGIFEGQRRCGKAEAARYGYGGGRDPLSVAAKLGRKLFDPDAELAEPAEPPPPRPS